MYSRSYYPTEGITPSPPENYDGVAFREAEEVKAELPYEAPDFIPEAVPEKKEETVSASALPARNKGPGIPFLSSLGLGNFSLGTIFGGDGGIFQNIGIEEILILAVAAYLIFSGSGDIECAIMLLLLLFIS